MPIYEFRCESCGQDFEELVFGGAIPPCPKCASEKVHKLMSACRHSAGHNPGGYQGNTIPASRAGGASAGGCAGCSGGSCATCK